MSTVNPTVRVAPHLRGRSREVAMALFALVAIGLAFVVLALSDTPRVPLVRYRVHAPLIQHPAAALTLLRYPGTGAPPPGRAARSAPAQQSAPAQVRIEHTYPVH